MKSANAWLDMNVFFNNYKAPKFPIIHYLALSDSIVKICFLE